MRGNTLDVLLIMLAFAFAFIGYRRGFILGVLSFAGFIAGALLGLQVAALLAEQLAADRVRLAAGVGVVLGFALAGQILAFFLGARLREYVRSPSARVVDGIGGGFVSVVAMLLVAWMMAAPLASAPAPWVASQVRRSAVIHGVDRAVPDPVRNMYSSFSDAINSSEFPEIFHGLTPTDVQEVPAPDPKLAKSPVVRSAHDSVVKVSGESPDCNRRSTGSGFVYAPDRVMTNAHVVAGTVDIKVELYSERYRATVVFFDPQLDIAVLRVPGLGAPQLVFNGQADSQQDAIVVGYPLDGPYTAVAARIRQRDTIRGPDIYQDETVEREVYAIRSDVKPGNSGGPLLSADGEVYGVIFAAAADDPETAFALTALQVSDAASQGRTATARVGTGDCH